MAVRTWDWCEVESEGGSVIVQDATHTVIKKHAHQFYEIVFVREGFCLHHLDGGVFLAKEGDVFLIKPGVQHQYMGNRECKMYNCLFEEDVFDEIFRNELMALEGFPQLLSQSAEEFPHMHLDMKERKIIEEILEKIAEEQEQKKQGWELKVKSLFYCLIVECTRAYAVRNGEQAGKDCYLGYVTKALGYIDEHYMESSLTVQELGAHVGISADYLSRQFKKVTGIAAQEYIRRYRLARAINCLQQGGSVMEAASTSGFHNISYFSREFKKGDGNLTIQI